MAVTGAAPLGWCWVRLPLNRGADGKWVVGEMVLVPTILVHGVDDTEKAQREFWSVDMERPRPLAERRKTKWVRPEPVCGVCGGLGWKALLKHPKRLPAGAILTHRGFEVNGVVVVESMQRGRMSCPGCCQRRVAEMADKKLRKLGARWGFSARECLRRQELMMGPDAPLKGWPGRAIDRMNVRLKCPVRFRESRWRTADFSRRVITVAATSAFEPYEGVFAQAVLALDTPRAVRDLVAERLRAEVFTILVYPVWQRWAEGAD